jgi:phosphate-selective porin OprO/OprP
LLRLLRDLKFKGYFFAWVWAWCFSIGAVQPSTAATDTAAPVDSPENPPVADALASVNSQDGATPDDRREVIKLRASDLKPEVYDSDLGDLQEEAPAAAGDDQIDSPAQGAAAAGEPPESARPGSSGEQQDEIKRKFEDKWIKPWGEKWIQEQDEWGRDGLRYVGKYGLLRLKLGGRVALDAGVLAQEHSLDRAYPDFDGSNAIVRSAQLQLVGNFGPHMFFKLQYEAGSISAGFKDAYVVVQDVPLLSNVRIGSSKEPFSLESLTSLKFNTFMERSLAMALVPGRSFGVTTYSNALAQRLTWAAGVFYRSADWGDYEFDASGGTDITVRFTGLPYLKADDNLLHFGFGAVRRFYGDDSSFSSVPESRLTNTTYVNTGSFDADEATTYNMETAWQKGPLTLQGEYTRAAIGVDGLDRYYQGGYIQAAYFLTGEHRPYNKAAGAFGRVDPLQKFAWGSGSRGAWELAVRVSGLDLDSGPFPGGKQHDASIALNWYPRRKMRLMFNYITGNVDSRAEGRFNILQARFLYYL